MDKAVFYTMDFAAALDLAGDIIQRTVTTHHAGAAPHHWEQMLDFGFGVSAEVHFHAGNQFLVSVPDYHADIFIDQLRGAVRLAAWEVAS